MRKIFPLILSILVGVSGYLYFNQDLITKSQIDNILIYNYSDYADNKITPFMKLDTEKRIKMFVKSVNTSEVTDAEISVTDPDFLVEIIDNEKKDVFSLWLDEDTTRAMYKNKESRNFYIITKSNTNKLKTLLFR